jgi:hypothetical protein
LIGYNFKHDLTTWIFTFPFGTFALVFGDVLVTYVYTHPIKPPIQIILGAKILILVMQYGGITYPRKMTHFIHVGICGFLLFHVQVPLTAPPPLDCFGVFFSC